MKIWTGCLALLISLSPVLAETTGKGESTVESFKDFVKIRHMSSRSGFLNNEPVTEFRCDAHTIVVKASGKVMGTNKTIKRLYERARTLADKGVKSNQRFFHVSFTQIEIAYMGNRVALDFVGKTGRKEFQQYEKDWLDLHDDVHRYLTRQISKDLHH